MKDAQLQAEFARLEAPDLGDARACQKRLQAKDARLELSWGSAGPHRGRWVVTRNAEDGQQHVVHVFQNEQGEYARPEPSYADNLMDITGRSGDEYLKMLDRQEAKKEEDYEKHMNEWEANLADKLTSDFKGIHGIKDSIIVSKDLK